MPRCKLAPRFPAHKTLSGHHTVPFTPEEIAALTGHAVEQQLDNHGFPSDTIDDEDVCCICFDTGGTLVLCDFCDGRWHGKCIGLKTKAAIAALPDPWACASCEKKGLGQGASLEVKATCTGGKRVSMPAAAEQKKRKGVISGYNLFTQAQLQQVRQQQPDIGNKEAFSLAVSGWKALSESDKRTWAAKADKRKQENSSKPAAADTEEAEDTGEHADNDDD